MIRRYFPGRQIRIYPLRQLNPNLSPPAAYVFDFAWPGILPVG
jgi:hypothetical protein